MTLKYPNGRLLWASVGLCFAILGVILIIAVEASLGRLLGYYLTQASPTGGVAIISMISTNVAGYTKKTTVAALFLIGYCVGNIIGTISATPSLSHRITPDRASNLSTGRCTGLSSSRDHDTCLLGTFSHRSRTDISVHPSPECPQGRITCSA